jgi:phospholipase/carboxylesterase
MTVNFDGFERETGPSPLATIIWLHGLGADAGDFLPIIPALVRPNWPALRFVFPNAPVRRVTLNGGMPMRAWYDILGLDRTSREDEAGIRQSIIDLDALIAREVSRGIAHDRILLAGFSQGGSVALATLLRQPRPLAGAILLSTWLLLAELSRVEATPASKATPVFIAHGRHDEVVTFEFGHRTADFLREQGYPVEWHEYPVAHTVPIEAIDHIRRWLEQRFAAWT